MFRKLNKNSNLQIMPTGGKYPLICLTSTHLFCTCNFLPTHHKYWKHANAFTRVDKHHHLHHWGKWGSQFLRALLQAAARPQAPEKPMAPQQGEDARTGSSVFRLHSQEGKPTSLFKADSSFNGVDCCGTSWIFKSPVWGERGRQTSIDY